MDSLLHALFWVVFGGLIFAARKGRILWPLVALGLLLAFNHLFTAGFFDLEIRDGHLFGSRIDILNHGSKVMLLALGMTLVIQLLAPSQRPVQVTTDLAGFWTRHYPAIRRELCRRYPRHAWPEDPWNAPATHRAKPRGT